MSGGVDLETMRGRVSAAVARDSHGGGGVVSVAQAVADAEAEALRAHEAGTCHLSEWSCSHCEAAAERMAS